MAAVVSMLRVSTRTRNAFRTCPGCRKLFALAPEHTHCQACALLLAARAPGRRRAA